MANQSISIDASRKNITNSALKIDKAASNTGRVNAVQYVNGLDTGTYTFSAYVNTDGATLTGDAWILAEVWTTGGQYVSSNWAEHTAKTDGWERKSVTFDVPSGCQVRLIVGFSAGGSGTVWYDDLQLEKGEGESTFNLVENSGFTNGKAQWTSDSTQASSGGLQGLPNCIYTNGDPANRWKGISQQMTVAGTANDVYSFGAWVKADSVPIDNETKNDQANKPAFNLAFTYDDKGNVTKAEITARKPATTIESGKEYLLVNAYSGLALDGGNTGNSGHLTTTFRYTPTNSEQHWKVTLVSGTTDVYTLQDVNYTNRYLDVKGAVTTDGTPLEIYTYNGGSAQKFKIVKEKDNTFSLFTACSNYEKLVDGQRHGNEIKQSQVVYQSNPYPNKNEPCYGQRWYFYPVETSEGESIVTETTYTDSKNFVKSSKDQRGNETTFSYNEQKGTLTSTTDAFGRITNYTYDPNSNDLLSVSSGGMTNSYAYENDHLKSINVNNALQYQFEYDAFGRTTSTKVGNGTAWRTLSSMEYDEGLLKKQTYGNGDSVEYKYDNLDRKTEIKYNGSNENRVVYRYGNDGSLAQTVDFSTGTRTKFTYDLANRLVSQKEYIGTEANGGTLRSSTDFTYADKTNYLTGVKHFSPLGTQNISYTYGDVNQGEMPDQVYRVFWNGQFKVSNSYDELGRLGGKFIWTDGPTVSYAYGYEDADENHTTTLVSSVRTSFGVYRYTYDAVGNITSVAFGTKYTNTDEYDSLNQLVRENSQQIGKTYTYSYVNGNITERKEYAYTTGELGEVLDTKTWSYTDGSWSDLLTNYNGVSISYDLSGNPTAIGNQTLTWNGRRLQSIVDGENVYSYKYNTGGQRVSKTVNGVTTEYFYNGEILAGQKTGDDTLVFMYDNTGDPFGFTYNGETYYYVKNVQNDVFGITNNKRVLLVNYAYDAWGKVVSVTDANGNEITDMSHIGHINPIRYRSYYYDNETNLYYLNSRYYSPDLCRFLNADDESLSLVSPESANYDKNCFAYCDNNPINRADSSGEIWHIVAGAVVGAAIGFATSVANDLLNGEKANFKAAAVSAAFGAVGGVLTTVGLPTVASIGAGALLGGAGDVADQIVRKGKVTDVTSVIVSTVAGGIGSAFGGKGALKDIHSNKYVASQYKNFAKTVKAGKSIFKATSYTFKMTKTIINRASIQAIKRVSLSSMASFASKWFIKRGVRH